LFLKVDATQIEINPFAETDNRRVFCVDAKLNFDDCAKFRQERVFKMDDTSHTDARELKAAKYDLNYVPLDGNIACLGAIFG
jgi:succinyl-CoA synthetase beta subunit